MYRDPSGLFSLKPLELDHIDNEYISWFDNKDGHLDYFTGSGRSFSKEVIINDYRAVLIRVNGFTT